MPPITHHDSELPDPGAFLPLSALDFQVLLVLSDRALHGYGIVKAATDEAGRSTLELGSLYRIISRLTQCRLIEQCPVAQPDTRRKRRYYRATALGQRVARAEARRLRALLESTAAAHLLAER